MKIGIQTWGSRGDINPWIALGQGLAKAGHEVVLYYTNYTGGDFSNYSCDNMEVLSTKTLSPNTVPYEKVPCKKIYQLDPLELTNYMVLEIFDLFEEEIVLAAKKLCADSDLIINNPTLYQTAAVAEYYDVPRINLLVESQYTPNNTVSDYNNDHINHYFLDRVNAFRETLGLPYIKDVRSEVYNSELLNILIYSKIFGREEEAWEDLYKYAGYLELKNSAPYELTSEIKNFLDAGSPPIFFSMGSLTFFEGKTFDILDTFLESIRLSGCRAIIQANWDTIDCIPPDNENILLLDYIPHEHILPHCAGVVHHGGAGTTHTSILCGCPSIVVAYAWDQFFWGKELMRMGIASALLKRKYIDELQLAGAIRKILLDPEFKSRTDDARRKVKREKGVAKSVRLIEAFCKEKALINSNQEVHV